METSFFYISLLAVLSAFILTIYKKAPGIVEFTIGIASIAYSLAYELGLGWFGGLYYYITPSASIYYIILATIFIYTPLNVIYITFLPGTGVKAACYTLLWIVGLLIFEYLSIIAGTVVLTGWNPVPWSLITYLFTYTWINLLASYIKKKKAGLKKAW